MQTPYFPPITPQNLAPFRALKALIEKDPNFLDRHECPYDPETKVFLRQMFGDAVVGQPTAPPVDLDTPEALEGQLDFVYADLMSFGKKIQTTDSGDKIQWSKAIVGILDRLISLKERTHNLKNYADFQKRVIDLLESTLEPAQRSDFVEKLGRFLHS